MNEHVIAHRSLVFEWMLIDFWKEKKLQFSLSFSPSKLQDSVIEKNQKKTINSFNFDASYQFLNWCSYIYIHN